MSRWVKVVNECMHELCPVVQMQKRLGWSSSQCEDSKDEGPFLSKEPKDGEGSSLGQKTFSLNPETFGFSCYLVLIIFFGPSHWRVF